MEERRRAVAVCPRKMSPISTVLTFSYDVSMALSTMMDVRVCTERFQLRDLPCYPHTHDACQLAMLIKDKYGRGYGGKQLAIPSDRSTHDRFTLNLKCLGPPLAGLILDSRGMPERQRVVV